ncbi:LysE family translocator [Parendozoicomonas sp. Alg238-R29]|uniref:LysE family translocator n=1 Tax=Parendozoicomonas sp. Alg238-R29 TaxID=2993446 RepID=UPI00248DAFB2|nr:LysE family translocator [Parendozoicomonas sp. Alg238-R29]
MPLTEWFPIFTVCLLGAISPGPSLAVVLRNTMNGSRLHGVATGVSHSMGIAFYALIVTTGISVLITETPLAFRFITWGGALYLAWLAINAFKASADITQGGEANKTAELTIAGAARQGFLISFLNPKIAVFFLALFSQFVKPGAEWVQQEIIVLTATAVDGIWYSLVALAFSHPRLMPAIQKKAGFINKLTGTVLLLIAIRIVLS